MVKIPIDVEKLTSGSFKDFYRIIIEGSQVILSPDEVDELMDKIKKPKLVDR